MHSIILTKKISEDHFFWKNLIKHNRLPEYSVEEVIEKYQGFEGDWLRYFDLEENPNDLLEILNECEKVKSENDCEILHVLSGSSKLPTFLTEKSLAIGYDIGLCVDDSVYSSIFHEVLFGQLNQLIAYKDRLNKDLLFGNVKIAEEYVALHDELSRQNAGVEDYFEMTIYQIWKEK